ncbi:MAG TPA: glyceraldehyde 3-phosphate dehydrogenase NAD-binding domain-containing protein [Pseudomonadales bacterium]|nr:glyceraldehyde 3-phosphate dehydrogenase NAD-binding domain-containing protein [Pseudomonadales bacterium]
MTIRLAINGYGRIGRCILRALYENGARNICQVVAINEPADAEAIAYLTRYDSTHGRFPGSVELQGNTLIVNGDSIALSAHESLDALDWKKHNVDIVLECSGSFSCRAMAEKHLTAGAVRVLFSQPADNDIDATIVCGVNNAVLSARQKIVSAASCTTNAIVPVIKVLDDLFGVENGVITTIHSAMNDQPVLDAYHHTDLRKTRAALHSLIPINTQLARGIERILPHLHGKFEAQAMRVPTQNVSAMDLSVLLKQPIDVASVNRALCNAANGELKNILAYTEEPLASCDFNHDVHSGIVDASQTRVSGQLVKVLVWFDNEWAYANRMLDIVQNWH